MFAGHVPRRMGMEKSGGVSNMLAAVFYLCGVYFVAEILEDQLPNGELRGIKGRTVHSLLSFTWPVFVGLVLSLRICHELRQWI